VANLGQRPKEKSISKNKRCKRGSIAALASIAQHRARRIQRRACDWGVARRMIEAVRAVNRAFSAGASGVSPNPGALPQAPAECCAVGAKQEAGSPIPAATGIILRNHQRLTDCKLFRVADIFSVCLENLLPTLG